MENKPDGVYSPFFIGCKSLDTVRRGRTPGDLLLPLAVGTARPPGRQDSSRFSSDHFTKCEHFVKLVDIAE